MQGKATDSNLAAHMSFGRAPGIPVAQDFIATDFLTRIQTTPGEAPCFAT